MAAVLKIEKSSYVVMLQNGSVEPLSTSVIHHLGFLKLSLLFAVACENQFCTIVVNFMELSHTFAEISQFFAIGFFLVKCRNLPDTHTQ